MFLRFYLYRRFVYRIREINKSFCRIMMLPSDFLLFIVFHVNTFSFLFLLVYKRRNPSITIFLVRMCRRIGKDRYPSFNGSNRAPYGDHSRWINYPFIIFCFLCLLAFVLCLLFFVDISVSLSHCVYNVNSDGLLVLLQ
jgi:hypothetical protein